MKKKVDELKASVKEKNKELTNLKENNTLLSSMATEGAGKIEALKRRVAELEGEVRREKELTDVMALRCRRDNEVSHGNATYVDLDTTGCYRTDDEEEGK